MRIFVTGTGTNVGKTIVSSWLCLHLGYDYFKPIQTGASLGLDSDTVKSLSHGHVHQENYIYKAPLSPHLAAKLEGETINFTSMYIPESKNLIIEGTGGLFVPINDKTMMIDLIRVIEVPVIIVARSILGTINHTLLSIEALRSRQIPILGVIMNGEHNLGNQDAIAHFGKTRILGHIPYLQKVTRESLLRILLSDVLMETIQIWNETKQQTSSSLSRRPTDYIT